MGKLKVAGWLADLEQRYQIVLYVVDSPVSSPWTQTCIRQVSFFPFSIILEVDRRQADSVMVVGKADDSSVGEYERLLLSIKTTARKELVLLHPERSVPPGTTRRWLKVGSVTSYLRSLKHRSLDTPLDSFSLSCRASCMHHRRLSIMPL